MTSTKIGTESWTEMFREIGLDEPTMHRWHALFEARHAEAHQSFLEWLGVEGPRIDQIRESSRSDWKS